jgi:hypothetical protein
MISTWTSAGKKSPMMYAANPCVGTKPPTQNAAARMERPGASSVLCAPPGVLVRTSSGLSPAPKRGCCHIKREEKGNLPSLLLGDRVGVEWKNCQELP